ncbi:MAG: hypothetical protein LC135_07415 [Phycisphaerae bacterium]|nr:hypothetical protein [Phycisphaerae bacterium]MCZ2399681.1 hypothetical protein [Phycisphaerae bacterium]
MAPTLLRPARAPARIAPAAALASTAVGLALLCGCAGTTYRQLSLGQERSSYDRVMPREVTRSTDLGLAYLRHDPAAGRTDAIVVLLTQDRRIAAKMHAVRRERKGWMGGDPGFALRGEIDPRLAELQSSGPVDTLRVIVADLVAYQGERLATDAHAWVAAGLVRLMQAWPNTSDVGVDTRKLAAALERVPGGGTAQIAVDSNGVYRFEYRQGAAP